MIHKQFICKDCSTAIQEVDNASGIDYLVTQFLEETSAVAKELRRKRIDIVHARTEFSVVLRDLAEKMRLAQRAVIAGVLDLLDLSNDQMSSFMCEMLPLASAPQVVASAVLYDLSIDTLATQAQYPQLNLRFCQIEIPNHSQAYAGETRPRVAQLHIGIQNFSGEWDLLEVHALLDIDPEESEYMTQITAVKE